MADEISVGSVSVSVVPDARGFDEKLRAALGNLPDIAIGVKLDDALANLQLDMLEAKIRAVSGEDIRLKVDLDGTALAEGQLALFDLEEAGTSAGGAMAALSAAVDEMVAAVDDVGANLDVANGALDDLAAGAESAGAGAASSAASFSVLGAAILGVIVLAGPITSVLIPALSGLVTVVGALTAGFAVAAVAILPVAKAVEAFHKAQLAPTTANMQALAASLKGMPGAGRGLVLFIGTQLWPAFDRIQRSAERGLFPGVLKALEALKPLIPSVAGFVGNLAAVMGRMAAQFAKTLASPAWRKFFDYIGRTAGPTLMTFGAIMTAIATGFTRIMRAFAPLTAAVGDGILRLARAFAQWTTTKGFRDFVDYVTTNAPMFAKLLGDIVVIAGKLLVGLAPLGQVIVTALTPLLAFLASLSPTQLLLIAAAIGDVTAGIVGAAVEIIAVAGLIVAHWAGVKGFFTSIGHWFSGPFVGFFRQMNSDILRFSRAIGAPLRAAWNGMKSTAAAVGHWFTGPFIGFFTTMGSKIRSAWNRVVSFIKSVPGKIKGFFKDAGSWLEKAGEAIMTGLWHGLTSGWHHVTSFIGGIGGWISSHKGPIEVDRVLLVPHGQAIMQGLGDGLKRKWPSVQDIVHAAGASIPQAVAAGIASTASAVDKPLQDMSGNVQRQVDAIKQKLSSLRSARDSLAQSLTGSLSGGGSLSNLQLVGNVIDPHTGRPVPGSAPGGQASSFLSSYAQSLSRFVHELTRARRLGLDSTLLDQIAGLGPVQGLPLLRDIEGGGLRAAKAQIASLNGSETRIQNLASKFGASQAQVEYGPKIDKNTKAVDRLTSELRALRHELKSPKGTAAVHARAAGRA